MKNFEEGSEQSHLSSGSKRARRKWILPLIGAGSLTFMPQGGLGQLIQLYLRGLNSSPLLISLATSLSWAGILLGSLFWGALSDSYQKKPLLFVMLSAFATCSWRWQRLRRSAFCWSFFPNGKGEFFEADSGIPSVCF